MKTIPIGRLIASTCAIVVFLGGVGSVHADPIIHVGTSNSAIFDVNAGTYHAVGRAGDYAGSTLELTPPSVPKALPFLFCLDVKTAIIRNTSYSAVVFSGFGAAAFTSPAPLFNNDSLSPDPNYGAIAWLIVNKAAASLNQSGAVDNENAFQLALWNYVYGPSVGFTANKINSVPLDANTSLAYAGYVSDASSHSAFTDPGILWINPYVENPTTHVKTYKQALVSYVQGGLSVPIPSNLVMSSILFGMLGFVWSGRCLMKRSTAAA